MRFSLAALVLSLCVAFPIAAHADSFEYTIVDNLTEYPQFLPYVGTYTFTVPTEITGGSTFVYGPGFTDTPFPGDTYVYASDFSVPAGSPVDQINIEYNPLSNLYAFTLYGALNDGANGGAIGTTLLQNSQNPNLFTADYAQYGSATMEITDLGPSQVPEPSSIILICTGALGLATQVRRRVTQI